MKKAVSLLLISIFILLIIPIIVIAFAGRNAMGYCITLFYIVNPVFFMIEGILSGYDADQYWYIPLESGFIYLMSMWILFGMDTSFVTYMIVYQVIGYMMLFITWLINRNK